MKHYQVTRCALAALILGFLPIVRAQSNAVLREVFWDISGVTVADLTNSAKFIANAPDEQTLVTSLFEAPSNARDNYGQRLRALITAPATGPYTFWIASDDNSDLYLSTDANPANKVRIAYVASWTASREWTKEANQQSAPIALLAGQAYFIEALMKDGGGGDNLAVRWLRADGFDEAPIDLTNCVPYGFGAPFIATQPADVSVAEGGIAVFTIVATGSDPLGYQWRKNAVPIAGAVNSTLTIDGVFPGDSGGYSCVVSNAFGSVTSAAATLTVAPVPCGTLSISVAGANATLIWDGPCQLESADSLSGGVNWVPVPGSSPLTLPASGTTRFFRTVSLDDGSCGPNIVGYVKRTLPSGYSLMANPLNGANNHLDTILPSPPDGTLVQRFDSDLQMYRENIVFIDGFGWFSSDQTEDYTLDPGEGFLIFNPAAPLVLTFVGDVPQGSLFNSLPIGFSLLSSIAPISGPIGSALSYPAQDGDTLALYNSASQSFGTPFTYIGGAWDPSEPIIPVGTGFRLQRSGEGAWVQSFNPSQCAPPPAFVVTSTDDSGPNTLRQAILDANEAPGLDTIVFAIAGAGPHTIAPANELPAITDPLVIDGYTQPGASPNEQSVGNNAVLRIELSGENGGAGAAGLVFVASDCTVRGLIINRFSGSGILVISGQNNIIAGNFIGTDPAGTLNRSNAQFGIFLAQSGGNLIGGTSPADRNIISANGDSGIAVFDVPGTANRIQGNYIGVNAAGTAALGNGLFGIRITGSSSNVVGGTVAGAGNLISGHSFGGVYMISAADNQILGNLIGTDASGTAAIPNASGIGVQASTRTTIGGPSAGARNIISGNTGEGITFNLDTGPNLVQGNFIGTDKSGTNVLGNGNTGITLLRSAHTTVGGTAPGAGNLISGNQSQGIQIIYVESSNNVVQGNFIGTDVTGTRRLGFQANGVSLIDSPGNLIGGTAGGARNVISGNAYGVDLLITNATGNTVQGNFIGTDVTGTAPIPNYVGVFLQQSVHDNLIGGTTANAGNVIAFNQWGVEVYEDVATGRVIGNRILRNSFFANTNAAINLSVGSFDNFRPNDPADADIGPNRLQNFPVLGQAVVENGSLTVNYAVDSAPGNSSYPLTIEFFAADGNSRQGRVYLGSDTYLAAQAGQSKLAGLSVGQSVTPGQRISATATDALGNTSEFAVPLAADGPSCAALPEGLVTWRRAEGDANDAVSANHGVLISGTGFGSGRVGQAFSFDGNNDLVNVPFAPELDLRNAITLEAWINPARYSAGGGGDAVIAGRPFGYQMDLLPDGRVSFAFPSGSVLVDHQAISVSVIPSNTFTHLAATYDAAAGEIKIYVNGTLDTTVASSGLINSMNKPLQIGGFSDPGFTGGFLQGLVDEVSIYNRALAANEISAIYAASSAGKCVPPVLALINGRAAPGGPVTLTNSALIELRSEFPGGSIFYTLDGSPPATGLSYSGPFTVTASIILRAIAYSFDLSQSAQIDPVTITVLLPPSISVQPASLTVTNGGNAVFSVSATGTLPLVYQWRFNGGDLAGQTSPSLTINSAGPANAGGYRVVIGNAAGSITSAVATLTVVTQAAVLESYSLDLPAGCSLIANQLHQGGNLVSAVLPSVPNGTSLLKWNSTIQAFIVETYLAGVGWQPGTTTLSPGEGAFINLPSAQTFVFAGEVRPPTLPLTLLPGLNLVSRQVPRPGTFEEITGLSPAEGVIVDQYRPATGDYRTQVFLDGEWRDQVPAAQVGEAVWVSQFTPPIITGQPAPQTNATPGSTINFAVAVTGTPPLRYQWQRNGVSISDATNASYTINNAQILDSGIYTVAVQPSRVTPPTPQPGQPEDLPGTLISAPAALRFVTTDFPFSDAFAARPVLTTNAATLTGNNAAASLEAGEPSIVGKPGGHSVWLAWMAPANGIVTFITLGSSFDTLLAAYTGNGFPGTEVVSDDDGGSFLSSRITFNVTAGQVYNIVVDGFGDGSGNFVLSWNLEVTAEQVPAILTQPQNQLVSLNGSAQFSVEATGANLTYQWFRDGQAVSGATSSNLIINPVRAADVGVYIVQINRGARFVLSQPAQLQIVSAGEDEPLALDKFQDVVFAATNNSLVSIHGKAARKVVARGFSGTQIFSSVGSTKEAGEPNHCGVRGGKSEWFSYQPTNSGTLKLDTDGSNFDTVLAVYVGPGEDFLTLTNMACDNNSGTNGTASSVLFNVASNTIYYIAVDGVNNPANGVAASGRIQLNYRLVLPIVLTSLSYSSSNNNGRVIFKVSGTPNVPATVQSASSLSAPVWTSLFTNPMANGSFTYTNTNALTFPNRFFRAINKF